MATDVNFMLTNFFCSGTTGFLVIVVMKSAKGRKCYGKYPQQQNRQDSMYMICPLSQLSPKTSEFCIIIYICFRTLPLYDCNYEY